jgi:short/branched chain acyl-CoA dehydrogenase
VPEENLLGTRGKGYAQFLAVLDDGRIAIAALAVGLAQACLDHSVRYATERHTFGAPIGSRQAVAFSLSDLAVSVEAARLLTYKAAWLRDAGRPSAQIKQAASIAKLYATEAAVACANTAIQVHGGSGYVDDHPVERYFRDVRVTTLYEGTSQIQKLIIGRALTGINALVPS